MLYEYYMEKTFYNLLTQLYVVWEGTEPQTSHRFLACATALEVMPFTDSIFRGRSEYKLILGMLNLKSF